MYEFRVSTPAREVLVDITSQVEAGVEEHAPGLDGLAHIFAPHTTAGVTINEGADPSVQDDIVRALAGLVPYGIGYRHAEGNSDAHIKTSLIGSHVAVLVQDGRLRLGTWQSVYLAEFDGPRDRRVWVELTPSAGS